MLAICPECKRTITVDQAGWQNCKFCGRRIWVADPMDPEAKPPEDAARGMDRPRHEATEPADPTQIPWERVGELSFLRRFFSTVGQVLFHFRAFFARLPNSPVNHQVRLFGIIVLTCGLIQFFQLQSVSRAMLQEIAQDERLMDDFRKMVPFMDEAQLREAIARMEEAKLDDQFFIISGLLSPLFALLILWLTSRIFITSYLFTHKVLPPPLQRIRRITVYSYAPWLFLALPVLPVLPAVIWMVVIQYHALRQGLGLRAAAAFFAVGLNLLLLWLGLDFWVQIHLLLR
ncbi:MAG: YIP1 family protein [Acidobacteria bacterium]|nr:YIP1 family protein [Acidobacteriota bacterium]